MAADVQLSAIARQTSGLTGADLANICNEAAIAAGRRGAQELEQQDFDFAVERVVAGLQQRKLITDKEKRVIAYHEAGHALVARLMSEDIHKVTIVPRGRALGFMMSLPEEDRYVLSKDELEDWLKVTLAGRAAEQVVFGRITNGAANDLDRATAIARSMVFDWGMGRTTQSQQVRADNYALSEETKRMRDGEQREITDEAYAEAVRLISRHRPHLDRLAQALLERETLDRPDIDRLLEGLEPESDASGLIGVALPDDDDVAHAHGTATAPWGCRSRCSAPRSRSSPPRTSSWSSRAPRRPWGPPRPLTRRSRPSARRRSWRRSRPPWRRSASGRR